MDLIMGERYDVDDLECIGWTRDGVAMDEMAEKETGIEVGYCWRGYFDADGYYRGPDEYGIAPVLQLVHPEISPAQFEGARRRKNMKDIF